MKNIRLYKRAFSDLFHLGKKYHFLLIIQSAVSSSTPFIGFIYVTQIIAALSNSQMNRIPALIIQYLTLTFLLQWISSMLQPVFEREDAILMRKLYAIPQKKMLTMQYRYAEDSEIREKLDFINRNNVSSQSSLPILKVRMKMVLAGFFSTIWGVILLFPLFTVDVSNLPDQYWFLNPFMILIGFAGMLGFSIWVQVGQSKKSGKYLIELFEKVARINAVYSYEDDILQDVQSGKEIRLYQLTDKMLKNVEEDDAFSLKIVAANYKLFKKMIIPTSGLFQIMNYLIYAYIGVLVLLGALPIALIIQLSSALSQMVSVFPGTIQHLMMMFSAPDTLAEYYAFLDLPDEKVIGSLPVEKRLDHQYHFKLDQVSFAYPGTEERVLKNLTGTFEVGKKYAVVGENGSGKTTFIKLLTRLYEPTSGEIKLNKINARKYDLREYFDLFGVVFQDYHLLGFSLGQNISVQPGYDTEQGMHTLEQLGLASHIKALPKQLDTYISTEFDESGVNFSGGQQQKIAIARALYKDAPVMVLDEPTAALDPITEFEIYQHFDQLVQDKTAFYISHRLSSAKFCDEILVFDRGEIVQRGSHKELVEEDGKYQELWNAQAQYYQ
ncbi:ABC transporter ATP-binding protein [Marinilactibacillus piezotolerans]|uniref:ABC transporter ATP-binding protein n=1 Tax=Marinilactibacillus piezotolerans TaxID=258723 RepID=UPI0009B0E511|nr:ABC transporter ATP-binding protein [Marinilactibacillus piezotolerans]